jgi:hypothetical protein
MATDVASDERVVQPSPPEPRRRAPRLYSGRFLLAYGALAVATAGAVAGLVIGLMHAGVGGGGPTWSAWKPSGGGLGAASQIAEHVSKGYRLPNGDQLVDVIAKAPSVSPSSGETAPLHYVAIQGKKGAGSVPFSISSSNSVMYQLCGLGASCSIASGAPTVARGTLVRREILELALYTFKYIGSIKHVIAFMPPPPGQSAQYLVYLQKSDLEPYLKTPLTQTLGSHVPFPATIPAREVHAIDAATESRVYKFGLAQAQTGDLVLVLTPLAA